MISNLNANYPYSPKIIIQMPVIYDMLLWLKSLSFKIFNVFFYLYFIEF